ncbi:MAG: NYN domain-containing protein [Candidatus Sungbacteria bacterium]|nr:NYN domain-containing protein [Candidatus Sungbacteria bacterium]
MKTFVFIDASNLFYGGEKSLGWKIDYKKLMKYLGNKYQADQVFYFGGVELHKFQYDYLKYNTVPLAKLEKYLKQYIKQHGKKLNEAQLLLISKHVQRVRFYLQLQEFWIPIVSKTSQTI